MNEQELKGPEKKEHAAGKSQNLLKESNSVGQKLRRLRKEKGLELEDIFKETNISVSNLVAVEQEMYDNLPADPFISGQIAIYGKFLGIDGAETAKEFLDERHRHQRNGGKQGLAGRDQGAMSAKRLSEPSYVSSASVAGFLLLLLVLAVAAFSLYTGWNPFKRDPQPTVPLPASSSLPQVDESDEPAAEKPAPAAETEPGTDPSSVQQQEEEGGSTDDSETAGEQQASSSSE